MEITLKFELQEARDRSISSSVNISGKHILITGAGKRLGRALSESFLRQGAIITAHFRRSASDVTELQEWSQSNGYGEVFPCQANLQKTEELKEMVSRANAKLGKIEILINCASDFFPTPSLHTKEDDWDKLFNTNVRGAYFLAQEVALQMGENLGVIINFCDINATKPLKNFGAYVGSKAALQILTKNLALELAPKIRVNSISPGPVLFPETFTESQKQNHIERTLLKRAGSPKDIVAGVLFLTENDYLTGFDLKVDGGQSLI